jgi:hypothetical protein
MIKKALDAPACPSGLEVTAPLRNAAATAPISL